MRFTLLLLAVLFPVAPALALDVWVDAVNGDNANSGATPDDAFRTITYALTQAPADDTLHLLPGIYDTALGEVFPLQLQAQQLVGDFGAALTLIQGSPSLTAAEFIPTASTEVRIEGVTLQGFGTGIEFLVSGSVPTLQLRNARVTDCGVGLLFDVNVAFADLLIEDVDFEACALGLRLETSLGATTFVTVRRCRFELGGGGVETGGYDGSGEYRFEHCRFADNSGTAMLMQYGGKPDLAYVEDSLIIDNGAGIDTDNQGHVIRTTIAGNADFGVSRPIAVQESIVFGNGDDVVCSPFLTWPCNFSASDIGDGDFVGQDGNFSADPLFRDPVAGDYRLTFGSPCVDVLPPSLSTDFSGFARSGDGDLDTQGGSDLGALELRTLALAGEPTLGSTVELELLGPPGSYASLFGALTLLNPPLVTPFGILELPQNQMIPISRVHFLSRGLTSVPFAIPNLPVLIGAEVHFQAFVRSPAAPLGTATTDRVTLTVLP